MSNIMSTEPKPQAPQAPPDGNAVASLVLGILGVTVIPFICSILAIILGRASIGDAYKRGEPGSGMAKAGVVLGWIGVAVPVVLFVFLTFAVAPWWIVGAFVVLGVSAFVMYYTRRNNRR
jgi:Domain of unknown function (DUF4190)